jgi:Protein of unknown function (DUF2934)
MTQLGPVPPLDDLPMPAPQGTARAPVPDQAPDPREAAAPSHDRPGAGTDDAERSRRRESRDELVRAAAYRRFQERGGAPGHELQDWLEAEAEVDGRQVT